MIGAMSDDPVNFELIEALERLAELKRQGLLTDAEVETVKNRILSAGPAPAGDAANEDESHRPAVDQPAPPPERDEEPEVDLQPPVIEEHNVDEQPLEPEAEDSQSSSRGDTRKTTSTHTSPKESRTTTAAQAQARYEKRRKKQQWKKRRRTIGALALVAIAVVAIVTLTERDATERDATERDATERDGGPSTITPGISYQCTQCTSVDISTKERDESLLGWGDLGSLDLDKLLFVKDHFIEGTWFIAPQVATCAEITESNGTVHRGIVVSLKIANATTKVETFYFKALLETPSGRTIHASSLWSTIKNKTVVPGSLKRPELSEGIYFFDLYNNDCVVGDYRFMLTGYYETFLNFVFKLP
jgi:hypothetical protein